jgi:hypothetical protein
MAEAVAWFPNQRIEKMTQGIYLKEWRELADRYSLQRFDDALKNVLRRVDFFPLPNILQVECEELRKASWTPGETLHVWLCEICDTTQASERAERCHKCGGSQLNMSKLTSEVTTNVEMKRYHERIKTNPEEFVRVGDIFKEAEANVARRKKGQAA